MRVAGPRSKRITLLLSTTLGRPQRPSQSNPVLT